MTTNMYISFYAVLVVAMLFFSAPTAACGWWGDGEQSSENAAIVWPSNHPQLTAQQLADADFLVALGNRYRSAVDPSHSYSMAIRFYELAAELNHAGAQYNLGLMHEMGLGVRVDRYRAAGWYKLAAAQDDVHAQHHLGELYIAGDGVERDFERGIELLQKAARAGHADLFVRLGSLYWQQQHDADNRFQAALWATLAVERGDESARQLLSDAQRTLTADDEVRLARALNELKRTWLAAHE